ncbi:MAG TPA: hypothetical protein VK034_18900, partial [Enhygromyxa sp.]|nr:hypothetical protein [Enhygromyxa sp.]
QFDVTMPTDWSVEGVSVVAGAECPPDQPFAWATAGTGTVEFVSLDINDYFPCELDVDAQFDLDTDPVTSVGFMVDGLLVDGAAEC